jgi:putative effector of murein hydrolase
VTPTPPPEFDTGPGPGRAAFLLAYVLVVLGGILGAVIGYGLVDVQCAGPCTVPLALGALVGGAGAAVGTGTVAVLTLRAMAEWRRPRR